VTDETTFFWDVSLCGLVKTYQHLGGSYCLYLWDSCVQRWRQQILSKCWYITMQLCGITPRRTYLDIIQPLASMILWCKFLHLFDKTENSLKKCKHCVTIWHVHFVMFSRYVGLQVENFKIVYLESTHPMENRHSTQYVYFVSLYKFICIISCSDK